MATTDQPLSADEFNYFATNRRRIRDQYALGDIQNTFQQGVVGNQYGRSMGDLVATWDRQREKLPYGFAKRGMLNSGVYQNALSQYGQDRMRATANLNGQYQDQMNALRAAHDQLGFVRDQSLQDIDQQETARRQTIAEMLRAARGY